MEAGLTEGPLIVLPLDLSSSSHKFLTDNDCDDDENTDKILVNIVLTDSITAKIHD